MITKRGESSDLKEWTRWVGWPWKKHRKGQCSPQSVRRSEDCSGFFRIRRFFFLDLSCAGLGLSGGRGSLVTIFGHVTNSTTKHTQVIVEAALTFLRGKLSIFAELVGDGGGVTGGGCGLAGFTRLVLVVVFVIVGVVVSRGRVFMSSDLLFLPSDHL